MTGTTTFTASVPTDDLEEIRDYLEQALLDNDASNVPTWRLIELLVPIFEVQS
jgi:hypothetical protein